MPMTGRPSNIRSGSPWLFIDDRRSKRVLTDDVLTGLNARGDTLRGDINRVAPRYDVALHASGRGSLMTIHPATHELIASDGATRVQARAKAHPRWGFFARLY